MRNVDQILDDLLKSDFVQLLASYLGKLDTILIMDTYSQITALQKPKISDN